MRSLVASVRSSSPHFWHALFVAFLLFYVAILFLQLSHGLASEDAHGAIKAARALVDDHRLEISRPPGHPVTEFYLFGLVAWILRHGFGSAFGDKAYLALQALAGVVGVVVFYELVLRLSATPWKAFVATLCLALSAQYFANTVDGEEFVFAILFLLLSLRLLLINRDTRPGIIRLLGSVLCFALATGCRPEAVLAGILFPVFCLLHPKLGWKHALGIIFAQGVAILVIWLPVLVVGLHAPWTAGMNVRESILGGGYRLVFQCFTPPVFIVFCWIFVAAIAHWRERIKEPFPQDFFFVIFCLTPIIFCAALFFHASKAAHVLFVVPFLLLLAIPHSKALVALAAMTILGCFASLDIFKDRQLVSPLPIPGAYFQALRQKPFYKLAYLRQVLKEAGSERSVIIADLWRWDLEYHLAHGAFPAREKIFTDSTKAEFAVFFPQQNDKCILLPRDGAFQNHLLEDWQSQGYTLKMDAILYRALFARYDVTAPLVDHVQIGDIVFHLFLPNEQQRR
jgi:hypothetical protein